MANWATIMPMALLLPFCASLQDEGASHVGDRHPDGTQHRMRERVPHRLPTLLFVPVMQEAGANLMAEVAVVTASGEGQSLAEGDPRPSFHHRPLCILQSGDHGYQAFLSRRAADRSDYQRGSSPQQAVPHRRPGARPLDLQMPGHLLSRNQPTGIAAKR
jgi:hypothetical protein